MITEAGKLAHKLGMSKKYPHILSGHTFKFSEEELSSEPEMFSTEFINTHKRLLKEFLHKEVAKITCLGAYLYIKDFPDTHVFDNENLYKSIKKYLS